MQVNVGCSADKINKKLNKLDEKIKRDKSIRQNLKKEKVVAESMELGNVLLSLGYRNTDMSLIIGSFLYTQKHKADQEYINECVELYNQRFHSKD